MASTGQNKRAVATGYAARRIYADLPLRQRKRLRRTKHRRKRGRKKNNDDGRRPASRLRIDRQVNHQPILKKAMAQHNLAEKQQYAARNIPLAFWSRLRQSRGIPAAEHQPKIDVFNCASACSG